MPAQEVYLRIDMDGVSLSHERDQIVPDEYRFVEIDKDDDGLCLNIEVWEDVEQEQRI
jgi:hypothetical protein